MSLSVDSIPAGDWPGFRIASRGDRSDPPRGIETPEGVCDRIRAAAFAEIQARDAFRWAADHFRDAPEAVKKCWRELAEIEDRHLRWLLTRLQELGGRIDDRAVSDQLWVSLKSCRSADEFAHYMAGAEERGRRAGERFHEQLSVKDPITAQIFGKIAEEEIEHIELARSHFPDSPFAHFSAIFNRNPQKNPATPQL